MTPASLKSYSQKDLAQMARKGGVRGWHSMKKDQLIKALLTAAHALASPGRTAKKSVAPARRAAPAKRTASGRSSATRPAAAARPTNGRAIAHAVNGQASRTAAARRPATSARPATVVRSASAASNVRSTIRSTNGHATQLPATNGHASNGHAAKAKVSSANGHAPPRPAAPVRKSTSPKVLKHLAQIKSKLDQSKNLAQLGSRNSKPDLRDRIVVLVRDSYWLHIYWEVTSQSVDRAQAAMGQHWHSARPCLRLLEISEGGATNGSERVASEITIHGGVSNWYLHVSSPPKSYRVEIGYLSPNAKFFALARSNVVTTPAPGTSDAIDEHWAGVAENFDKIYAMSGGYSAEGFSQELQQVFEERLRRPMGSPMMTRYGEGVDNLLPGRGNFRLEVDAELIVFGATEPNAHLSLRGEPVKLRPDGSFTVRLSLPNQRQVVPIVASSSNGGEQRTIVLALERNTKVMEPILRESSE